MPVHDRYQTSVRDQCVLFGKSITKDWNVSESEERDRGFLGLTPQLCDPQQYKEYSRSQMGRLGREVDLDPIGHIGCGLAGHPRVGRMPSERRLTLGKRFPFLATVSGVLFKCT